MNVELEGLHRLIVEYLEQSQAEGAPVVDYLPSEALRQAVDTSLPEDGSGEASLLDWAQRYLDRSVRTGNHRFFNQLWAGFSLPGFMGEVIAALSNTSMYTFEMAPVATQIEQALLAELGRLVGFDEGEGLFVTGGSNANLVAMMLARHRAFPEIQRQGLGGQRLQAFVSDQAHYSFRKGALAMGLGLDNVVAVASDDDGRMRPEALRQALTDSRAAGATPFFVAATAGTTVLGAFDPIEAIADICEADGLWFHIDGAWGGSVAISDTLRPMIRGSRRADSFTWDQHKMLGVPLICSTLLLRQAGQLRAMNHVGGAEYIFHADHGDDLGPMSLQCGRRVDALKLWFAWKAYGRAGLASRLEHSFALAQRFAAALDADPEMHRVAPVASLNICFEFRPEGDLNRAAVEAINLAARDRLAKSGEALINHAVVGGRSVWRMILANPELSEEEVDALLVTVREACRAAQRELGYLAAS